MEKLEFELIIDGGHRRRWTAREKLQIVEGTLKNRAGILVVARHNAMAPNLS